MNTISKDRHLLIVEKGELPEGAYSKYAEIDQHIKFDSEVWDALADGGCQRIHYDLMLICAAVEFADRKWHRLQDWSRFLRLTVPVIELETWQSIEVKNNLEHVLRYLTGDVWRFDFVKAKNAEPCEFKQMRLYFDETEKFAIAYSEGLDSRAVSALEGKKTDALCIRVANKTNKPQHGDSFFTQIPFRVDKENRGRESSFRSRGFQFAAMTSIAAHIRNLERIVVPESGQGALGPAMLPLHGIYADYRNYPMFFRKMERFVEVALNHKVHFDQPRLWFTKGQTLNAFLELENKSKQDLIGTRSCWQKRHIVNVDNAVRQCGLCAACILRRFSMHAAGLEEPSGTYVIEDLTVSNAYDAMSKVPDENDQKNMVEYGVVGVRHFKHLADMAKLKDEKLRLHASEIAEATGLESEVVLTKLRTMLAAHAKEWEAFLAAQGEQSFLRNWTDGGTRWAI